MFVCWLLDSSEGMISLVCCGFKAKSFCLNTNVKFKMESVVDVSGPLSRSTLSPSVFCSAPRMLISEECVNQLSCPLASGRLDQWKEPAGKPHRRRKRLCLFPSILLAGCGLTAALLLCLGHVPPVGESVSHSVLSDTL